MILYVCVIMLSLQESTAQNLSGYENFLHLETMKQNNAGLENRV